MVNTSYINGELAHLDNFIYYTDQETRDGYATFGIVIDIICMYCGHIATIIITEWVRVNYDLQTV